MELIVKFQWPITLMYIAVLAGWLVDGINKQERYISWHTAGSYQIAALWTILWGVCGLATISSITLFYFELFIS